MKTTVLNKTHLAISSRLKQAAVYALEASSVVDVGSDHGYLPIYLASAGFQGPIYATENKKGPFLKLQQDLAKAQMQDRITCLFADGLEINAVQTQEAVITGMGGLLICSILKKGQKYLESVKTLVLEPQTDFYEVHKLVLALGYTIQKEVWVQEGQHEYPLMKCIISHKAPDEYTACQLEYGKLPLTEKDSALNSYLHKCLLAASKAISMINDSASKAYKAMEEKVLLIKEGLSYYELS